MTMSVKNKAKDRDHNGRIRREYTSRHKWGVHYGSSPGWWVKLFMTGKRRICAIYFAGSQLMQMKRFSRSGTSSHTSIIGDSPTLSQDQKETLAAGASTVLNRDSGGKVVNKVHE
jgi:hypothetical protein